MTNSLFEDMGADSKALSRKKRRKEILSTLKLIYTFVRDGALAFILYKYYFA